MGWTTINHTCGHETREQLYGKMADRDRKASAMGQSPCLTCRAEAGRAAGLTGTDKQIAWAHDVMTGVMGSLTVDDVASGAEQAARAVAAERGPEAARKIAAKAMTGYGDDPAEAMLAAGSSILEAITDASWWIEHRHDAGVEAGRMIVAQAASTTE